MIRVGGSSGETWLIGEIDRPISTIFASSVTGTNFLRLGVELVEVERGLEAVQDAPADGVLARLAVVEEVGRREEAGHRRDPAGLAIDRVLGLRVALVAGGPLHQREVPARRAAADAQPVRVDPVVLGVVADEPDGPVHVAERPRGW